MKDSNELVNKWLEVADDDLSYAQIGFAETDFFANICFSSQQAFEKYLKGYLVAHNVEFPKIHSLTKLLSLCLKIDPGFAEFKDAAEKLSPYSIAARYPDISDLKFSKQQAVEALEATKRLGEFVKKKINRSPEL